MKIWIVLSTITPVPHSHEILIPVLKVFMLSDIEESSHDVKDSINMGKNDNFDGLSP